MPCDTGVVRRESTVIFAKNSDRQANEAQFIEIHPACSRAPEDGLQQCTYIRIPWEPTFDIIISRPTIFWGAEMGVNCHGVCIGNEALFASVVPCHDLLLTGMDLVRLALERSTDATSAVRVITTLLEEHGQGGDCGFEHAFYYHNGFVIVDAQRTFFLYTVGKNWYLHDRTTDAVATMSNTLPAGLLPFTASRSTTAAFQSHVQRDGIRRTFLGWGYHRLVDIVARGSARSCRLEHLLSSAAVPSKNGTDDLPLIFEALRDHNDHSLWRTTRDFTKLPVCMHAGVGPTRHDSTTNSMVVVLGAGALPKVYATGTSSPCLSAFKIVPWSAGDHPAFRPRSIMRATYDSDELWWASEFRTRQLLLLGDDEAIETYRAQMRRLEATAIDVEAWDLHRNLARGQAEDVASGRDAVNAPSRWNPVKALLEVAYAYAIKASSERVKIPHFVVKK